MKRKITLSLFLVMFLSIGAFAQVEKVLDPTAGFLNNMIMSDTASNGNRVETEYKLQRDGVYYVRGAFENYGYKLHMTAVDGDGEMPIIRAFPNENGDMSWAMVGLQGDVEVEGIYIDGQPDKTNSEMSPVAWPFVSNKEGATVIFNECVFANAGQGAVGIWNSATNVSITNCKFYNMGNISFWDLGNGRLIDCRSSQIDKLTIKNNTIVNSVDRILRHRGGAGVIKELVFDHNTIVNSAAYHGFIELGNVGDIVQITNNLIIDGVALGSDQSDVTRLSELDAHGEKDANGNPLMVWVGSIPNDLTTYTIAKNVYSVSAEIQAFYTAQGVDEGPDQMLTAHIKGKLGDAASAAFVKQSVTLNTIPGSMADLCAWYYSAEGANKEKVTTTKVDYDRMSYDFILNGIDCGFTVTNDLLGTDGLAVGDKYWNPIHTDVRELAVNTMDFRTFPNPFSEVTNVHFNLTQDAIVTVTISDISGKTVQQINSGVFKAGANELTINKGDLMSGLYILTIKAGNKVGNQKVMIQ